MDVKNVQGNETIYEMLNKYTQEVTETQDEFIFYTLRDFLHDQADIVVQKDKLFKAISLLRMVEEHGPGIYQCWSTATAQSAMLSDSYRRGFQDGVKKEHDRIMDILERKENQNE